MKRALAMFVRALRRRCPHCGGGPVITGWIHTRPACPRWDALDYGGIAGLIVAPIRPEDVAS